MESVATRTERKGLLLGNEAVVRGALEAGISVASTYPGTPASEIGDTFAAVAKEAGIYFEYSVNEKLAFETAYGASLSGSRAIVSFKQFGFNVAADSILPSPYFGIRGGLVLAVADDPNCYSSAQSEQDTRYYSRLAKIPTLEPSDSEECRIMTKAAFEISERYDVPVIVRLTTKVSHSRGIVNYEEFAPQKKGAFAKDDGKFNGLPPHTVEKHAQLLARLDRLEGEVEGSGLNFVVPGEGDLGIITSGISHQYVMEALERMGRRIPVLKLGFSFPLPEKAISSFISALRQVLVVEELEPILEQEVERLAKSANPGLVVMGKNVLPETGEYTPMAVLQALAGVTGVPIQEAEDHVRAFHEIGALNLPKRTPTFCPGCPHRATFYATRKAVGKDAIFGGDIGCYILGSIPPIGMTDYSFDMGASVGVAHGIKKGGDQKVVVFLGDSTFYHAGIEGIVNVLQNHSSPLIIVLDNRITAMTGHQPNPATKSNAAGEITDVGNIEDVVKALGVRHVRVVNPFNQKEVEAVARELYALDEPAVMVARRDCWLLHAREERRKGREMPKFVVDQGKCTECGACVYEFGCPAFEIDRKGKYGINDLCLGCAVCVQVCPAEAIRAEVKKR